MTLLLLLTTLLLPPLQEGDTPGPATTSQAVDLVQQVQPSVVVVYGLSQSGEQLSLSSGFLVKDGLVATARHGLLMAPRAAIMLHDGQRLEVTGVLGSDREHDLLLLAIAWPPDSERPRDLPLADSLPAVGTSVLAFGSPLGVGEVVSDGLLSGIREEDGLGPVLSFTAPISPGSSGGPIVGPDGRVLGVVRALHRDGQNLNLATPATFLRALKPQAPQPLADWLQAQRPLRPSEKVISLVGEATRLLNQGDLAAALPLAQEACELDPTFPYAWQCRALIRAGQGQLAEGVDDLLHALRFEQEDPGIYSNLGALLGELGRFDEETEAYRQALAISPGHAQALYNMGSSYEQRGAWEWARHWYQVLHDQDPQNVNALLGLGRIAGNRGHQGQAIQYFIQANRLDPTNPAIPYDMCIAHANMGEWAFALRDIDRCLDLAPTFPGAKLKKARILQTLGRHDEEYRLLKEILGAQPASAEAHALMGALLIHRGDRAGAIGELKVLQELDAEAAEDLLNLIYPDIPATSDGE